MSAEILREAAALMRSRANGATSGPWSVTVAPSGLRHLIVSDELATRYASINPSVAQVTSPQYGDTDESQWGQTSDAEHIASWHTEVALAVADWLDAQADDLDTVDDRVGWVTDEWRSANLAAIAVARAYLGEATDG